jgi:hypothetical protein
VTLSFVDSRDPAFAAAARAAFEPLIADGFREVGNPFGGVELERGDVWLWVTHEAGSHQIGVALGRRSVGDGYSLQELLTAVAPSRAQLGRVQTANRALINETLRAIAATLRDQASDLLAGDGAAFDALGRAVAPERRRATHWAEFGPTLLQGDAAWQSGDRRLAAELYTSALPALNETRRRRLAYLDRSPGSIADSPADRLAAAMERRWAEAQAHGEELKDPYLPIQRLSRFINGLNASEQDAAFAVLIGWLDDDDGGKRYDALWLVLEYGVTDAIPKLRTMQRTLAGSEDRAERDRAETLAKLIGQLEANRDA